MTDEITMMKLKDIHPYPGNPRRIGKDAVDAVARSIEQFGWQQPIVVDKEHTIIVGHTRYKAAQKLGLKEVPVLVADLDERKAAEYRVADNRVAEFSTWDYGALLDELQTITGIDMADFGFAAVTSDGEEGGGSSDDGDYVGTAGTSAELDLDDYGDEELPLVCPHCGFRFKEGD